MAAAASVVSFAVFATPSHAIQTPGPSSNITVLDHYTGAFPNVTIVGQVWLGGCNGTASPPNWGVTTGAYYIANLSCDAAADPPGPKPFPVDTTPASDQIYPFG